jgi:putative FmdB family regulatory protein
VPIYGYRCNSCGHQFEVYQRMSDDAVQTCPNCQGKVSRVLYPSGVVFKGSGYYSTDYKDSAKSSAPSNGSSPGSGTESKPEPKSESKSDSSD